jgi:hypothetical protein
MATYNKFNDFTEQQIIGTHDWDANTFKIMLVNSPAPVATNTIKANLTEISAGNGYTAGGTATTITVSGDVPSAGYTTVQGTQVVFTASGGSIGPFQYAVLYNDTAANKNLVAWWDNTSAVTLNAGDTFTVKFNNATPGTIFTLN